MQKINFFLVIGTFVLGLVGVVFCPSLVQAASLSISEPSGAYKVGEVFDARVIVSSPEQSINAMSGVVRVSNALEIVSLGISGSIVRLWTQNPALDSSHTAHFEGVVLNPGFQGRSGTILTLRIRAKSVGQGVLSLSSGTILANDGKGTSLPVTLGSRTVEIGEGPSIELDPTTSSTLPLVVIPLPSITVSSSLEGALVPWIPEPRSIPSVKPPVKQVSVFYDLIKRFNDWQTELIAGAVSLIGLALARTRFVFLGFLGRRRRRRKIAAMETDMLQTLAVWKRSLDRQYHRFTHASQERTLTPEEAQTLRDVRRHQGRLNKIQDLIVEVSEEAKKKKKP